MQVSKIPILWVAALSLYRIKVTGTPSILDSWETDMPALSQGSPKTISGRANFHPRIWYLIPLYELLFKESPQEPTIKRLLPWLLVAHQK